MVPEDYSNTDHRCKDAECFRLENSLTAGSIEKTKEWSIWAVKGLVVLYLAACLWTILAAVKDAVVAALEPLITIWKMGRWLFGQ
jgi:hypothetical protein